MRENKVGQLLRSCGAVQVRHNKHRVWRLPNGVQFVQSTTPKNEQALKHEFSRLKRLIGV